MGLAEKRIQEDFVKTRIPERMALLKESTGGATEAVKIDFDWDSMMEDRAALEQLWSVWEQPLGAIEEVCKDDLGKKALKAGLKKIVLRNVPDDSQIATTFANGVLTVCMNLKNGASGTPGWTVIQKAVEDGL